MKWVKGFILKVSNIENTNCRNKTKIILSVKQTIVYNSMMVIYKMLNDLLRLHANFHTYEARSR